MNLIEALKVCKETGCKIVKRSWTPETKIISYDYTIPSYIYWNPNEEAFVAVFGVDPKNIPDTYARLPEDHMCGVMVSNFAVSDILSEDWTTYD